MQGINKVILMGRLGQDPEIRQTAQGRALCRFGLATRRSRRQGSEWVEETDWHDVVLWEQQAERAGRVLGRGDLCAVEGRLSPRTWQDPQGQKRKIVEVVATRFQLVSSNRARRQEQAEADDPAQQARAVTALPTPAEPF
jgi:single-strand DNA-binding protein